MRFCLVLVCVVAVVAVFSKSIKGHPGAWYALCFAIDVLFAATLMGLLPSAVRQAMLYLVGKCALPLALFAVVMFIGAFSRESKVGLALRPIRAELSLMACILSVGHMAFYLRSYVPVLFAGGEVKGNVAASFVLALVLLCLLVLLGVTSLGSVKRRMDAKKWKKLQLLAYPFFLLVYVHLVIMLAPAAIGGGSAAVASIAVYSALFGCYAVARVHRALVDRKEE